MKEFGGMADGSASAFDVPRHCARFLSAGHNGMLGLVYRSHSEGRVELELPYGADFIDGGSRHAMHEGCVMTLFDMAGTVAVWSRLGRFRPHATVDFRIEHLRLPGAGAIVGEVTCYHVDDTIARTRGIARSGDEEIASFAAAYMFTDRK